MKLHNHKEVSFTAVSNGGKYRCTQYHRTQNYKSNIIYFQKEYKRVIAEIKDLTQKWTNNPEPLQPKSIDFG